MWLRPGGEGARPDLIVALQTSFETFYNKCKCIILNKIQKMLFTLEVVVEAGERKASGSADVANGSGLKAVLGKDLGRYAEDMLEFGFGVAWSGNGGGHSDLERSFD